MAPQITILPCQAARIALEATQTGGAIGVSQKGSVLTLYRRDQSFQINGRGERVEISPRVMTSHFWASSIFEVVKHNPGIGRYGILGELDIPRKALTNGLTTLRRRGVIANRGTKKNPNWYATKETAC